VVKGDGDLAWGRNSGAAIGKRPHIVVAGNQIPAGRDEIAGFDLPAWGNFYGWGPIWKRSSFIKSSRGRLAFVLISRIYPMTYADTGIATDSARVTVGTLGALADQTLPASPRRQSHARGAWTATAGLRVAVASSVIVVSRDSARSPAFPQKNLPLTR
jgi:hypothetical protein